MIKWVYFGKFLKIQVVVEKNIVGHIETRGVI